jgi:PAS domain S-box-containing protein
MDAVPRFRAGEPRPFQICLSFQDVSARQRTSQDFSASQERFRLAMEATRDGIWDWNVDTGEVFYNPGYTRMLGWEPEEFRDRVETWSDLIHPEDRERVLEVNQACIDGRIPQFEVEYRIRTRAGEWKWILGRGKRIVGEGREPARRLVGTHVDISERKHAEQMQRMYEEELQQAQKLESLGSLAGGVAHDMNNILAAIQAVTQTLQHRHLGDPGLARGLAAIEKASLRGRDLVQGLTNFARKDLRESTPLDLNALLRDEIELFRRTTLQKVQLTLDLEERLPAVLGERGMLESAVMNLCVNAVEAMPAGGTLTLRTRSSSGGMVELLVADSGEGMAPEVLARAKEPFFTTKPVGKGTGLGLALVHATVKAHGGALTLQSEVGRGCTVRVQLPALSCTGEGRAAVPAPASGRNPLRILLVDDDELIRATVPPMLQLLKHRVIAVAGGREALHLLAAGEAFDLVLLDLNMPGMNGAETLSQMRRRHPRLPVLMATGHLDEATARMLRQDPCAAGLAKPFSMAELDRKLQELGF